MTISEYCHLINYFFSFKICKGGISGGNYLSLGTCYTCKCKSEKWVKYNMVVRDKVAVLRSLLHLLIITAKATGITWYVSTKRK